MKTHIKHISCGVLIGLLNMPTATAEDIETIVVSGARTPILKQLLTGPITIIDSEQIAASKALNVADLLRANAGFSLSQSGGPGAISELRVRGSESNHVLLLLDGVELNDLGQGGLANLAHINLDNIERVEILKGAQSALWGSGAVGGVINLVSRTGSKNDRSQLSAEVGQSSSHKLAYSHSGKTEDVRYSLSLSHLETDGQNISPLGDEKDGYRATQLMGNALWDLSAQSQVKATLRYLDGRNEFDDFVPSDADKHTDLQQFVGQLVWTYGKNSAKWQQQIGAQITQNDNENFSDGVFDSRIDSEKLRVFWQHNFNYSENGAFSLVAEHSDESYLQDSPFSFQKQDIDTQSLILDMLHEFSPHFNVTASYRYDDNSEFDGASSYKVGVNVRPTSYLTLYANYGKAVKNPTFTEVFGFIPQSFTGNPDLLPESSFNLEAGLEYRFSSGWEIGLSVYDAKLEDEITTIFFPDFTSTAENVLADSERKGAEFSARGDLGPVQVNLSVGYNDSEQPDFSGALVREARRAKHTAQMALIYPFNQDASKVYAQVSYQGDQLDTDFSTFSQVTLGGYTLVDLSLSHELDRDWQVYLRANNLFDKGYQDVFGFNGQEQRLSAGVQYEF